MAKPSRGPVSSTFRLWATVFFTFGFMALAVVLYASGASRGIGTALMVLALLSILATTVWSSLTQRRWAADRAERKAQSSPKPPTRVLPPLRPGEVVEEVFQHPDGELYLGVRRSREPKDAETLPLALRSVPMQWMGAEPARVRFTMDRPELFNPDYLPTWDLPSDADTLVFHDFEHGEIGTLPVPGGFREIHVLVSRKSVSPRGGLPRALRSRGLAAFQAVSGREGRARCQFRQEVSHGPFGANFRDGCLDGRGASKGHRDPGIGLLGDEPPKGR